MLVVDTNVVIIGGGIMGLSLLYHLGLEGWTDCVLVEKGELTSGSTWHAAGQVSHSVSSYGLSVMNGYAIELYQRLEDETGQSVSWHNSGSLRLAYEPDELDWLYYTTSVGKGVGHRIDVIGPERIAELHPFYNLDGVLGALYTPDDGHVDPAGAAFAWAAGARRRGATILRNTRVTDTKQRDDSRWVVSTENEEIVCNHVVNAAGTYARQVGQWPGLSLPIINMTHHYLVTEEVPALAALDRELPIVRDDRHVSGYIRMERNSGLIGIYEKANPNSVWLDGTPWEADHHLFSPDYDRIGPWLEAAFERMPLLAEVGIVRSVHGAITHPPDGNMLLGPAPGLRNYWCATGSQIGIAWGPGAGKYLAQWMVHGAATLNLRAFDPRRYGAFATPEYNYTKAREDYCLRHEIPYPGFNRMAGRPYKTSPIYHHMDQLGAVFEEVFGWERPRWFVPHEWPRNDIHSFKRPAWHPVVAEEVRAVREDVGVADLTAFAKYEVGGPDAAHFLDRLVAGRLPNLGRIGLSYMHTEAGMVEAEFTVARLAEDRFYLVGAAVGELRFEDWMQFHLECDAVEIVNVSDAYGVVSVAGPKSRDVLAAVTDATLDNDEFPWLAVRDIKIAGDAVRALRLSFTGELGWELHIPMDAMAAVFEAVWEAGEPYGMQPFGSHALNSMRMEKAYKVSADMTNEVSGTEANLGRFLTLDKPNFVGKAALEASDLRWSLVYLEISADDADALGGEGVFIGERRIGVVTTAAYGHYVNKSLAWAYVDPDCAEPGTEMSVLILGRPTSAVVLGEPVWDPTSARARV